MLTNDDLEFERPHDFMKSDGSVQRIYNFKNGHGLSAVNNPMLHSFTFAWEIAVLIFDDKGDWTLDYETELTDDVLVFMNDEETNQFIKGAKIYFESLHL